MAAAARALGAWVVAEPGAVRASRVPVEERAARSAPFAWSRARSSAVSRARRLRASSSLPVIVLLCRRSSAWRDFSEVSSICAAPRNCSISRSCLRTLATDGRLAVAAAFGELRSVEVAVGVGGERELEGRVQTAVAVLCRGHRTERLPRGVELLRPAGGLVLQCPDPLPGLVRLLLRAVVLLGRDLRLLVQLVHLRLDLRRCQLRLGVSGPVEARRRRRARQGDRPCRAGRVAAGRALTGLSVRCHVDCTSFRTTASSRTSAEAVAVRPSPEGTVRPRGAAGVRAPGGADVRPPGGGLRVRRRPAQGERAAAGPFSAVVSDCRPWPGRRWGAGHLVEDAKPRCVGEVTRCAEVPGADRGMTVSERDPGLAASCSRCVLTDVAERGCVGVGGCYGAYMQGPGGGGVEA